MFRATRHALGKVLVFTQVNTKGVSPASLSALTAASSLGDVTAFVAGDASAAEKVGKVSGVSNVIYSSSQALSNGLAENTAAALVKIGKDGNFTHIVGPSSSVSKGVIPRVGALLDSQPLSDVTSVISEDTFIRGTYAGNAITKVKINESVKVITVRAASFNKAEEGDLAAPATEFEAEETNQATFVSAQSATSDKPDLQSASKIVSGGRGLKDPANWPLVENLAAKIGAAVGASRAVVDAEWVPADLQVGQTGKVVAPDLYIAAGISGAIQHVSGMKDSKTIVAINTDEEAPIMALADYGLVADALKALPELTEKL